eukprot:EG_transcript_6029
MRQAPNPADVKWLAPAALAQRLVAAPHDTLVLIPSAGPPGTRLPCVVTSAVMMYLGDAAPSVATLETGIGFHERVLFRQRQWCDVVLCGAEEGGLDAGVLCNLYHLLLADKFEGLETAPPEILMSAHDKSVYLLAGGVDQFREEYPHLCDIHSDVPGSELQGEYRPLALPAAPESPAMVWVEAPRPELLRRRRRRKQRGRELRGPDGRCGASADVKALRAHPSDAAKPPQPIVSPRPPPAALPTLPQRLQVAHQRVFRSLHASPLFQAEPPSRVLAHLYLGSAQNAAVWRQLKAFNITHVLVVGTECKAYFPGHFKYLHFDVCDRDDDTRIRDAFEPAVAFIEEARHANSAVLVHCFCGISRSAAVVLAYLIQAQGLPLGEALAFLQAQRPRVCPNDGFMRCLAAFDAEQQHRRPLGGPWLRPGLPVH